MDVKKNKRTLDDLFNVIVEVKDDIVGIKQDIKRLDTRIDNLVKVNKLKE
ncbi:hypothetical protein [Mycoplasmoides pirum]|nr:hypothetical protein [Mycoplasmoides pirum]